MHGGGHHGRIQGDAPSRIPGRTQANSHSADTEGYRLSPERPRSPAHRKESPPRSPGRARPSLRRIHSSHGRSETPRSVRAPPAPRQGAFPNPAQRTPTTGRSVEFRDGPTPTAETSHRQRSDPRAVRLPAATPAGQEALQRPSATYRSPLPRGRRLLPPHEHQTRIRRSQGPRSLKRS